MRPSWRSSSWCKNDPQCALCTANTRRATCKLHAPPTSCRCRCRSHRGRQGRTSGRRSSTCSPTATFQHCSQRNSARLAQTQNSNTEQQPYQRGTAQTTHSLSKGLQASAWVACVFFDSASSRTGRRGPSDDHRSSSHRGSHGPSTHSCSPRRTSRSACLQECLSTRICSVRTHRRSTFAVTDHKHATCHRQRWHTLRVAGSDNSVPYLACAAHKRPDKQYKLHTQYHRTRASLPAQGALAAAAVVVAVQELASGLHSRHGDDQCQHRAQQRELQVSKHGESFFHSRNTSKECVRGLVFTYT